MRTWEEQIKRSLLSFSKSYVSYVFPWRTRCNERKSLAWEKNNTWKIEIQIKLLARTICSDRDGHLYSRYICGDSVYWDSWRALTLNTCTPSRAGIRTRLPRDQHTPVKATKRGSNFQALHYFRHCHYLSGYRDWRRRACVRSSETKARAGSSRPCVRPMISPFDTIKKLKEKRETYLCDM